ncbi:MAG: amidohydrolase/deacetylase family metallohydrolase [Chloroflexi bacterium]|nr:amidohydrolase/deacetylase family metallohydrolase [Chloroflexota bacterium]MDA1004336.1 amidohydrolase/deacetylase family metallohydrolase [Chloroflexota bacterium]
MSATLLHGGAIVDPVAGTTAPGDVLIRDGMIAALGPEAAAAAGDADLIDVSGCRVAPGFIDIHTHVFDRPGAASSRLPADRVGVRQGVACLVDAGSAGAATIDEFPTAVHATQRTPAFALVNVGSPGVRDTDGGHSSRPELVSLEATVRAVERHRGWVRGIKVQASHSHTGEYGLTAVAVARQAADRTGLPLMMHIGNGPPALEDALAHLRAGDIVTHAFHGKPGGALTAGGAPLPALVDAVARGVIVDIGHGRSSFAFATAERALAAGLPVHTISTDIHRGNVDGPVVSLARTMTKLMLLGLSVEEAVRAVTVTAARALRLDGDGFGTLAVGRPAHVTVFRVSEEQCTLEDAEGERRVAECSIVPVAAYVAGERFAVEAPI